MKLKEGFILHKNKEKYFAVATGKASVTFNGLIENNITSHLIFKMLLENTDKEKIIESLYEKFEAPKEIIEKDVNSILNQLRNSKILDE